MSLTEREQILQTSVVALYKAHGKFLKPERPEDALIIGDYAAALQRVPTAQLVEVFREARNAEKLPSPRMINRLNRSAASDSYVRVEHFTPGFADFLRYTYVRAVNLLADTKTRGYRKVADMTVHAEQPEFRDYFKGYDTDVAIQRFKHWMAVNDIPDNLISEVCQ